MSITPWKVMSNVTFTASDGDFTGRTFGLVLFSRNSTKSFSLRPDAPRTNTKGSGTVWSLTQSVVLLGDSQDKISSLINELWQTKICTRRGFGMLFYGFSVRVSLTLPWIKKLLSRNGTSMVKTNPTVNKIRVERSCVAIAIWTIMLTDYGKRNNMSHWLARRTRWELWRHELKYKTMYKNSVDVYIIYDTIDICLFRGKARLRYSPSGWNTKLFCALRFRVYTYVIHMVGIFDFISLPQFFVYFSSMFQFLKRLPLKQVPAPNPIKDGLNHLDLVPDMYRENNVILYAMRFSY